METLSQQLLTRNSGIYPPIVVLEKTLESPSDCKKIQTVHSEGDQAWDFFGRNDAKAETPVLWPPHAKSWFIGKDSDAGRDWGQKEKGTTEDEMAGWHHQLDGRESQWTPGVGDGQGGLVCCDSWGRKESDMTERLNWTELNWTISLGHWLPQWTLQPLGAACWSHLCHLYLRNKFSTFLPFVSLTTILKSEADTTLWLSVGHMPIPQLQGSLVQQVSELF